MAVYECIRPSREMLQMKPAELKALLAEQYDIAGMSIPLEINCLSELMDIYKVPLQQLERIENTLKHQGIYVCHRFIVRSLNRRPWQDG